MFGTQQYREYIKCTFNGFCKTVLYRAALNEYRALKRKQQHEVSFDYLREILFLRFYLGYSDIEIGKMFGRCRSSINRRKNYALRLLQKEMEALQNEER